MYCGKYGARQIGVKHLILPLLLILILCLFTACGSSDTTEEDNENTDSVTDEESAEDSDSSSRQNSSGTLSRKDRDQWYKTYTFFEDEEENYFEVTYDDDTEEQTQLCVTNYGDPWETVYLTANAEDYVETDDGGYKYYDTSGRNSVMTFYPDTLELVLMASEFETYTCFPAEEMSIVDPYGFATGNIWWDTNSQRCNMDIQYLQNVSTGECHYEVTIAWSSAYNDSSFWEIKDGAYDESQNAIVFSDCRYYTKESYADGTMMTNDVYTNGTGSIVMNENHRLYWNDNEQDTGANCVFENTSYDYSNIYEDFIGVWYGQHVETQIYGDVTEEHALEISPADDGGFYLNYIEVYSSTENYAVFAIEDIEYSPESGITFHLPETFTNYDYRSDGQLIVSHGNSAYLTGSKYTITSNDGKLTIYRNGDVLEVLYKTDDEPSNSSSVNETDDSKSNLSYDNSETYPSEVMDDTANDSTDPHYATSLSEVTSDVLSDMRTYAENYFYVNVDNTWGSAEHLDGMNYLGCYFLTTKSAGYAAYENIIYLVYSIDATTAGESFSYYLYFMFTNVSCDSDGNCSVDLSTCSMPTNAYYPSVLSSGYYYNGYGTLDELYSDCVTSGMDAYNYESTVEGK